MKNLLTKIRIKYGNLKYKLTSKKRKLKGWQYV